MIFNDRHHFPFFHIIYVPFATDGVWPIHFYIHARKVGLTLFATIVFTYLQFLKKVEATLVQPPWVQLTNQKNL